MLAFLFVGSAFILGPRYVKGRCMEAAARHGIVLTVHDTNYGFGTIELLGTTMRLVDVPEISATAEHVELSLAGLTVDHVSVESMAIAVDGPLEDVATS